ncbi:hypothetical protein HQ576_09985, partial [bacterium]|nr:hypothetical protein [bacterium]
MLLMAAALVSLPGCGLWKKSGPARRTVFYPLPPDPPRIQYLTTINGSWDVARKSFMEDFVLGKAKSKGVGLVMPYGVTVRDGKIYVADYRGGDVHVYDVKNRLFSTLNKGRRVLGVPTNLSVANDGHTFVCESMRSKIQVFGPDDQYITTYTVKDSRPGDAVAVGDEL